MRKEICIFLFLHVCILLRAQNTVLPFNGPYHWIIASVKEDPKPKNASAHFSNYNLPQGLSSAAVNCIYQDKRGFVWIGTGDGLDLFDGNDFSVFRNNRFDSTSICDNDVRSIAEDKSGMLWIGTRNGVSRLDPFSQKAKTFVSGQKGKDVFAEAFICRTYVDAQGRVWVYNQNGIGFFSEKEQCFKNFFSAKEFDVSAARIHCFFIDSKGSYWVGTESSLCEISDKGKILEDHVADPRGSFGLINSIKEDKWGKLWSGSWGGGFGCYDPSTKKFSACKLIANPSNPSADNIVLDLLVTKEEVLWVCSNRGLYKMSLNAGSKPQLDSLSVFLHQENDPHSIASDFSTCLMQERSGDLWVGTGNGLSVLFQKNQVFVPVPNVKGNVMQMLFDKDEVWTCAWYGDGLVHYDKNFKVLEAFPYLPPSQKTPDKTQVSGICKSRDGTFWIASFKGLMHYDPAKKEFEVFKHNDKDSNSIISNRLNDVWEDEQGDIWVATYKSGLERYSIKEKIFRHFTAARVPGVCDDLDWDLFSDEKGTMYCGTNSGLMYRNAKTGAFESIKSSRIGNTEIRTGSLSSSCVTRNGEIWFGGDNGLFCKRGNEMSYYSTEDGLCNKTINGIAEDGNGNIWIGTDNGLACWLSAQNKFVNYGTEDGLPSNEVKNVFTDGKKIYVNVNYGLCSFDPSSLTIPAPYNGTYFSKLSFSGIKMSLGAGIENTSVGELPYDKNDLDVSFTSPVFASPGRIHYRYMLEGADNDWKVSGPERAATYANLAPGDYVFKVQASDAEGNWKNEPASFSFTIRTPFWAAWWFRTVLVIVTGGMVYAFFYFRAQRKAQLEKVRSRIARDLHDDIGSTLSSINILSEMAKQKMSVDKEKTTQLVTSIGENSQAMLEKMDDIVWSIKPENDQLQNIISRMREYASQTLEAKNIAYEFRISEEVKLLSLPIGQRYDFFLVFKESVNNLAKYADCKNALLEMSRQNGTLLLQVEDDGKGFEFSGEQEGNGLRNMKKRAEALKGKLEIRTEKGKGTTIILKVPVN